MSSIADKIQSKDEPFLLQYGEKLECLSDESGDLNKPKILGETKITRVQEETTDDE